MSDANANLPPNPQPTATKDVSLAPTLVPKVEQDKPSIYQNFVNDIHVNLAGLVLFGCAAGSI